ncbi:hypothetical protein O181_053798 [Austropuccinia psidii MF-1]|uniref:Uncharacterized protein n=1 Tax=Austropuccinia psidii MF-1 TaxID=1389203 RepID=A0A9Q3E516_9BASI|nr:hypothetical protein [Austropuccinia psidii MF-1]
MQLEVGLPQDTENKNLCKHTQDAQTFLVAPNKGMVYIHRKATIVNFCVDNAQQPLIIDSGENFSKVVREYLEKHFPNGESQLLPTKARNFKSASGKMKPIGTIIKEMIIPHRRGNIILNPELVIIEDAYIQGFLCITYYQRMYEIKIYNSKNRHTTIGTKKEIKCSLDIYYLSNQDTLKELINEFRD